MQNYAQIGDIDHNSLHIIFIISFVCLFVCSIITQEPLDLLASKFD